MARIIQAMDLWALGLDFGMPNDGPNQAEDLKKLSELCRHGHLFEVQDWIRAGKPYQRSKNDRRGFDPFRVAVQTGFHSLIEIFLKAGVTQDQRDRAFFDAFWRKRIDLMKLLLDYGASLEAISERQIASCHNPAVQASLTEHGLDWGKDRRIFNSLKSGVRGFLRTFLRIRSSVPSSEEQAAMALRYFVQEHAVGSIALLLWAKVNPRLEVPDPSIPEDIASPLSDMVSYGDIESIKKVGLDAAVDDPTRLLHQYFSNPRPAVIGRLLDMGAKIDDPCSKYPPVEMILGHWLWKYGHRFSSRQDDIDCLLLLAAKGGRWNPRTKSAIAMRRRSILELPAGEARAGLKRLIEAGLFPDDVLRELLRTPAIRKHLAATGQYAIRSPFMAG